MASIVFDLAGRGEIEIVTSVITVAEVLVRPESLGDTEVVSLYEGVFQAMPNFTIRDIGYGESRLAAQMRARYNILLPDAFQLAIGLIYEAKLFLTNDKKLKKIKDIEILCLSDFI